MRLPHIAREGFRRIAQVAPVQSPAPQVDMEQMRRDIDTLHQWIDYFNETHLVTQREISELSNQVQFLEEYVYSTSGQPAEEAAPVSTEYDPTMTDILQDLPYPTFEYY